MHLLMTALAQSSDGGFRWELLFGMPTIIFTIGGAIAIAAIVSANLRAYYEAKQLNRLKSDMIQRGLSADEIARIIESGQSTPSANKKVG